MEQIEIGFNKEKKEFVIETIRFKNKKTGEIKTQVDILELNDYERIN